MRRFLLAQFSPVLQAWRNGYEGEVRRSVIAFFVLILLAFGVCLAVPEVRLGLSAYLQGFYQDMDLTDETGALSPLALFLNNLRACVVTMLYGSDSSENSWFSLRIMQAYKDRNCMSPCILSNAVPQSICFVVCLHTTPLCCLTCFVTLFSFQGAGRRKKLHFAHSAFRQSSHRSVLSPSNRFCSQI